MPPPSVECGCDNKTAVWLRERWFCAREPREGGCGFERHPPPVEFPDTPLCRCEKPSCWEPLTERFVCARPRSMGGCGFAAKGEANNSTNVPPTRVHFLEFDVEAARNTAALLTASAYGVSVHCFVAPCDVGLGLFARSPLKRGQAIVEYYGPRLPLSELRHAAYALEVPDGSGAFIDGNHENVRHSAAAAAAHAPSDTARSPAIYANHSRAPNCTVQHWPGVKPGKGERRRPSTMWLVATEDVEAGAEIRFDYEHGGASCWRKFPPRDSRAWRHHRVAPPPPVGSLFEPTVDYLPELLAGEQPVWPEGAGEDARATQCKARTSFQPVVELTK